ncbi:MAG: efflux RND transporter periplasmic adaptor subunit [Bacteroidales bacterium]|jgi:HlyD family secretion protein
MKKNKTLKIIGIVVLALIVFIVVGKKAGWIGNKGIISIATDKVTRKTIIETVSANGKVQPVIEVKISPDVSGQILELNVKEGDSVKKGDLLAKINPDIYESNLERMVASLNTTKANLANSKARQAQAEAQFINAKLSFERNEKLWKQNAISASEYDAAKSQFEVAKAEVDAAKQSVVASEFNIKSSEASIKEAQDNLTKTTIFAPCDGTISKLNVENGERVVGTSQFTGTEMMRIANLNEMEVNVEVNENDIVRVKLNDTALIEIDAFLNRKFKGIVTEIATSANTTGITADQVTNFVVKIRILKESYRDLLKGKPSSYSPFRPGMSATVDIQTKTAENVICVPIEAVTSRGDTAKKHIVENNKQKNKSDEEKAKEEEKEKAKQFAENKIEECVFIYAQGKAKLKKVKTGIQDNTYIEILSGLKENDEIITSPYRIVSKDLKDGDNVKKVDKKTLYSGKDNSSQ